ncbi:MAG: type II toxin-antitoxin system VapC family toxin [Candidatus Thermoplasmatota archaeon]|nr:type II toxin-antitoxin system VapC family toxin [Candidatus Thermoplasmatota archaeon]
MAPVIDTNVLIDLVKGNPSVKNVLEEHSSESASITVINRYEFLRGIYASISRIDRREMLLEFLDQFKVYDFTSKTARVCAEIYSKLRENGLLINELDIIILSICAENHESIITNDKDFLDAGEISGVKVHFPRS